jgi:hypothetical protein
MKRILLIALCLMCIAGTASAYELKLDCPDSIQVGLPLKCSIDSDFPAGRTFDIVFYQTQYTSTEVSRQPITIQGNGITQYKFLDTLGLPGGNYKVEVQYTGSDEPQLRTGSVTLQLVKLTDRSGEITITSPLTQSPDEALRIEGSITKLGNEGVKIEVSEVNVGVITDAWIGTKNDFRSGDGIFTKQVMVTEPGDYEVKFTDAKGYIGTVTFHVVSPATQAITAVPTTTAKIVSTKVPTTVPTPWPTATQSPMSPVTALVGIAGAGLVAALVMKRK